MKEKIVEILKRKEKDFTKVADEILQLFSAKKRILQRINESLDLYSFSSITSNSALHKEIKAILLN